MAQNTQDAPTTEPDEQIKALHQRLTGRWRVTGGTEGTVTYRPMDGGFFLIQDVDLAQYGRRVTGFEVIGREKPFGAPHPGPDIVSRFYDDQGHTFDYVYELDGTTLTIWGGEKSSPAYFKGTFDTDGNTLTGAWVYPGGGGYDSTMTRIG
ncbi:hypothetical protein [Streptomyces sp. MST-110588]|uniref:hypothetical protein n=1 Tax=Streptomyces sp. MST-110588 TaxID=2833628 RepID=UPI001F5C0BBC|nr:hypothetical protein [Streptomyces sp. MST-110588]UNO39305.1 hypothetical protein KGS77_06320 [Streptomyces sp. MST-110588]